MVICLERDADLHMAQLKPVPLTVSWFSKIQIGFTFLVPAHSGSPGQRAIKRTRVCVLCVVCIIAVIEHVRDGCTVRAFLLPAFQYVTVMLSGIKVCLHAFTYFCHFRPFICFFVCLLVCENCALIFVKF